MGKKRIITKAETAPSGEGTQPSSKGKAAKRQVLNGIANICVSYNNTIVTIADQKGEVIAWSSAGSMGFKGTKKSTPYAANIVAKDAFEKSKKFNLQNIRIVLKGIGPGREAAMRGLAATGLNITSIQDKTPIAHNGIRSKKPRRV